jgi:uncharacterized phage protein (TIGR02220 family)
MIAGGYYIKARQIQSSEIATAPPVIREVWDWLLREANHCDDERLGIKRGELIRTLMEISDGLSWFVGYRKMRYSKSQCENATKVLMKHSMITTTKTTRGLHITICNYGIYQNPKNYEANSETNKKPTRRVSDPSTINKNEEEDKNEEEIKQCNLVIFFLNEKVGTSFKTGEGHLKHIRARLKEGFSVEDLKKVIEFKTSQWKNDIKMEKYLRPSTLFNSEKCDGYLQEAKRQTATLPPKSPKPYQTPARVPGTEDVI